MACCAVALLAQTRLLLGMPLQPGWTDGFVFGGTVFGYHWTHPDKRFRLLAWTAGLLGGICFLKSALTSNEPFGIQLISLIPVFFWGAYYGFLQPGKTGLRESPIAKPLTIALAWAWVTVFLPTPFTFWSDLIFILLGRGAFIFALALAYDLSDTEYDRKQGLNTLTRQLGDKGAFTLIYLSLAFAGICMIANVCIRIYPLQKGLGLAVSLLLSAWWLHMVFQRKSWEPWQKLFIDGLMIVQFLCVLAFAG